MYAALEQTTSRGSVWNLAAKAKILASHHFANLHRIKFPLNGIFFQNNSRHITVQNTTRKPRAAVEVVLL